MLQDVRPARTGYAGQRELARVMMAHPCERGGMVVVFGRDRRGREHRGRPLVWRDTDAGRFVTRTTVGVDGQTWVSHAPADTARLGQRIAVAWATLA